VLLYHQGNSFEEISTKLSIHHQSVRKYINLYILGGFKELCKEIVRPQSSQLSEKESIAFKEILLTKRPLEVGLEGNIWTGKIMCQYLKETYNIDYKSGIYDLLERLNLSHRSGEPSKSSCRLWQCKTK
jgi:transposase